MRQNAKCVAAALVLVSVVVSGQQAMAGDPTPPAGPVGATFKTLDEVEARIPVGPLTTPGDASAVYRITQPGSYYLTGNVVAGPTVNAFVFDVGNVSLDLNGYSVIGPGPGGIGSGLVQVDLVESDPIIIRNGAVRDFGGTGIIFLGTTGAVIQDVVATDNGGQGIRVENDARVERCTASDNDSHGISVGNGSLVRGCVSINNNAGIAVGANSSVIDSRASFNTLDGLNGSFNVSVHDSAMTSNGDYGISLGNGASVRNSVASSNTSDGMRLGAGSSVIGSVARTNGGDGIESGTESVVRDCTASINGRNGVFVQGRSMVIGNACHLNGASSSSAGIHVIGSDSHIEGNMTNFNDFGIAVGTAGNFIIKNTASNNTTNYSFVANNYYGKVVDLVNAGTPAVSGNSGTNQVGTAEPWSNFAY